MPSVCACCFSAASYLPPPTKSKRISGNRADLEMFDIHRIGYHRDLVRGNTARGDIAAQTLADAADRGGAFEHVCLQRACGAIARVAIAGGAVIDGGVFPERAYFIDERQMK